MRHTDATAPGDRARPDAAAAGRSSTLDLFDDLSADSDRTPVQPRLGPEHAPIGVRALPLALAAAAVVATIALVGVLAAAYPGLRFTAARPQAPATSAAAVARPVASFAEAAGSPAEKLVQTLLAAAPAGLPGGLGPASAVTGTVAPAIALTCDQPVAPVVSRQRSWAATSGSLGSGLTITASAYSAGAGAEAMRAMGQAQERCRGGAAIASVPALGVEALRSTRTLAGAPVEAVLLRRGDVVVSVTGVRQAPPSELLADLDHRLDMLLTDGGTCADQQSSAQDFVRSLVAGRAFVGLEAPHEVPLPAATSRPALVTPSAPIGLPAPVTATTPAEPYWPPSAPAALASPTAPSPPAPYPTVTSVPTPRPDVAGPGCGWAFTGMHAPVFDEAAAARTTKARSEAAVIAMSAAVAAYPQQALAYSTAWSAFERQAAAYAENTTEIAQVEAAWAIIRQQQQDYATALAQYDVDLKAYTDFAAAQHAAVSAYQQALAECATASSSSTGGTDGAGASSSPDATTPSADATSDAGAAGGAGAPAAAVLPAAPVQCPPVMDPIMTATPPASPVSPLPPADPRPTPMPAETSR